MPIIPVDGMARDPETIISADRTINVPSNFSTIQAALDSLKYTWIPKDVTVTIQVAAGTYSHTSPIVVDHPQGLHIGIIGATPVTTTITGVGTITGSAGNWSVPVLVQSTSGIAAGDYVIIGNTTGTGDYYAFRGIWKVISVDSATQITVQNTHRKSTFPTATLSGGTAVVLKTILKFTNSTGLAFGIGSKLGYIDNIALVGDGSVFSGIDLGAGRGSTLVCGSNFGVNGFGFHGIYGEGSNLSGSICVCGCGKSGVICRGGSFNISNSVVSGNGQFGVYANTGFILAGSSTVCGNGYSGFATETGGRMDCVSCIATGNGDKGFASVDGGFIYANGTTAFGNTNSDYCAAGGSSMCAGGYQGTPTFSPALGTVGNNNSIIYT